MLQGVKNCNSMGKNERQKVMTPSLTMIKAHKFKNKNQQTRH